MKVFDQAKVQLTPYSVANLLNFTVRVTQNIKKSDIAMFMYYGFNIEINRKGNYYVSATANLKSDSIREAFHQSSLLVEALRGVRKESALS